MARRVFDMFPGRWEVGQHPNHAGSHVFWERVIGDYTGGNYRQILDEDGEPAQAFDTPKR